MALRPVNPASHVGFARIPVPRSNCIAINVGATIGQMSDGAPFPLSE
jgi:hypothetical protein